MAMDVEPNTQNPRFRIFLSYARVDRARVAQIIEALEAAGFEVWWDALIDGGATFAKTIAAALEASDAVVVVWSKNSIESDWVLDEAMYGRDHHRLIPVTIDGSHSPLGFRQYQAIDLSTWRGDEESAEWTLTLRAIASVAAGAGKHLPARAAKTRGPAPVTRRGLILGGAGLAIVAAGAGGYLASRRPQLSTASANSVAVLPFRNVSGDAAQAFFSDGLSEEMRNALSRNNQLQVAAQTSSNLFRDRQESAQAIAAKLGVAFLLDGSVRRAADTVRVDVSLIDASTGFNRWSQVFDRMMQDIFAVQSEIADTVAATLAAQIATRRPNLGGTANVVAFDAYLRGRALYHQDSGEQSDRVALTLFEAAITADPDYASAYAARARSLLTIAGQYAAADVLPALYDAAESAARRAVAIAPDLADAHYALADVLFGGRLKVRAARESYDRAYQLGAGDADLLSGFAFYSAQTGRADEASAAITRAVILDPLNARAYRMTGWVHYAARRYAESIPPLQRALSLNHKLSNAHASIGDASLQMGLNKEAHEAYLLEPSDPFRLAGLAIAEHRLRHDAAAQAANAQLVSQLGDSALYQQAQVLAQWDKREPAIDRLLRARQIGDEGLLYSHSDPLIDSLRGDARFQELQTDLGFE
jgi:TolB-like protein/Tfp pilus assembly protein PilF